MLSQITQIRNHQSLSFAELAGAELRSRNLDAEGQPFELCQRAFSSIDGTSDLESTIRTWALDGWRNAADSLAGVYRVESAPNYLEQEILAVTIHPRPGRLGRGATAPVAKFGIGTQSYRLMRWGVQFTLDEQDLADTPTGLFQVAVEELLRGCRNLVGDLLWSVILTNPTLDDGVPAFDASRGNLLDAAVTATGLKLAVGAIAGQTRPSAVEGVPTHLNLRPNIVVVAPNNVIPTRQVLNPLVVDGNEFSVRSESRLSNAGVLDPRNDSTLLVGNDMNWLMAADSAQTPSLVLVTLNGRTEPSVRVSELTRGEWGYAVDLEFSAAATIVDSRGLCWSTGVA